MKETDSPHVRNTIKYMFLTSNNRLKTFVLRFLKFVTNALSNGKMQKLGQVFQRRPLHCLWRIWVRVILACSTSSASVSVLRWFGQPFPHGLREPQLSRTSWPRAVNAGHQRPLTSLVTYFSANWPLNGSINMAHPRRAGATPARPGRSFLDDNAKWMTRERLKGRLTETGNRVDFAELRKVSQD